VPPSFHSAKLDGRSLLLFHGWVSPPLFVIRKEAYCLLPLLSCRGGLSFLRLSSPFPLPRKGEEWACFLSFLPSPLTWEWGGFVFPFFPPPFFLIFSSVLVDIDKFEPLLFRMEKIFFSPFFITCPSPPRMFSFEFGRLFLFFLPPFLHSGHQFPPLFFFPRLRLWDKGESFFGLVLQHLFLPVRPPPFATQKDGCRPFLPLRATGLSFLNPFFSFFWSSMAEGPIFSFPFRVVTVLSSLRNSGFFFPPPPSSPAFHHRPWFLPSFFSFFAGLSSSDGNRRGLTTGVPLSEVFAPPPPPPCQTF